jgi:hypothetical protein
MTCLLCGEKKQEDEIYVGDEIRDRHERCELPNKY